MAILIFPIEIPIEAEKIYHHGKELSYRENKMCSETSEAMRTTWEHAQLEFQKFLKIFPLKFPLKLKNTITMERSRATEETKYVLRPVKQWEQLGNMHNLI